uniref:C3H1-type domain-containing protein n=1 Tax=Steinernema glaseri TaxID=37863 RepID=A0A1I7Z508_9BILA
MYNPPTSSARAHLQVPEDGQQLIHGIPFNVWHALTDEERAEVKNSKRRGEAYKTALCHSFKMHGHCNYGDQCRFAHGECELRLVAQTHPKYKTQLCNKFSLTGMCPYGSRCQFIHRRLETTPRPDVDKLLHSTYSKPNDLASSNFFSQSLSAGNIPTRSRPVPSTTPTPDLFSMSSSSIGPASSFSRSSVGSYGFALPRGNSYGSRSSASFNRANNGSHDNSFMK